MIIKLVDRIWNEEVVDRIKRNKRIIQNRRGRLIAYMLRYNVAEGRVGPDKQIIKDIVTQKPYSFGSLTHYFRPSFLSF